jgi:hypothetical protein
MRLQLFLSLFVTLAVLSSGCNSSGSSSSSTPATPPSPVSPKLPEVNVAEDTKSSGTAIGLLPSTDPTVRTGAVSAGQRSDPFSGLNFTPEISSPPPTPGPQSAGVGVGSPAAAGGGRSTDTTGTGKSKSKAPAQSSKPPQPNAPSSVPTTTPPEIAAPPPPSTELANAVEVTGVVQLGGAAQAIVKAPNEPSSRNVQAGERLSNGEVLVKRITADQGMSPVVVLEQNGVEVIKTLTDKTSQV